METKKITCIVCPAGCKINTCYDGPAKKIISSEGNECKKGLTFIEKEIFNPVRLLTTTIKIDSVKAQRLPVRTNVPVHKNLIPQMIREVKKIKIKPPVEMGQILKKNILKSGADIISSTGIDQ